MCYTTDQNRRWESCEPLYPLITSEFATMSDVLLPASSTFRFSDSSSSEYDTIMFEKFEQKAKQSENCEPGSCRVQTYVLQAR